MTNNLFGSIIFVEQPKWLLNILRDGGEIVKIDVGKLNMMLARRCMALTDLRSGTSPQTLTRIMRGEEVKPRTVGRIANALGVDVADIIEKG